MDTLLERVSKGWLGTWWGGVWPGGSAHERALDRNWAGFAFLGHCVDVAVGTWDCGRLAGHARTWASLRRLRGGGGCSGSCVAGPRGSRCERAVRS